ncbi:thioredoxin family protein (plasmid) [Rhizobium sp. AB2/73]|uniref:thioredoxin family protein n=2 Tax=unclassified Rhizobium TaxID=2613769 RepID=UPI00084CA6C2|nr:thioredoxin family protein [Rhizobium sp. YK2]OEC95951.1 hypothetical protein A9Z06_00295 [Rhizobium sp. YK2]QYA16156.1 thioredoxin family protein [Rhizobium sp. AB2/73]UEQ84699.1 thioredoxin family protein [Rhizobium sp. AB2/73]
MNISTAVLSALFSLASHSNPDTLPSAQPSADEAAIMKAGFSSQLPQEGSAPPFSGATGWLNSAPLDWSQLRGKVVLVNFWTYSCINSIRALPYLKEWADKYKAQGLTVIGVHSPEFAFEKITSNVQAATKRFDLKYPIALDSDFKIWRSFGNNYWPAFYLVDGTGTIRYHQFGEGSYDETEAAIRDLLRENGGSPTTVPSKLTASGAELPADFGHERSSETYLGYEEARNFASTRPLQEDQSANYHLSKLDLNHWGLEGKWTVGSDAARLDEAGGAITFRFSARDLHLVMGPPKEGKPVHFKITIDGKAPENNHGADTDAKGTGTVDSTRLYQLVRQANDVGEHTFTITFEDAGVQAFVFTFG